MRLGVLLTVITSVSAAGILTQLQASNEGRKAASSLFQTLIEVWGVAARWVYDDATATTASCLDAASRSPLPTLITHPRRTLLLLLLNGAAAPTSI